MTAVMIGVDPHKGSHTAVAIDAAEEPLGKLRVRASAGQAQRLVAWAAAWPERTWAVEGAGGLGHLLAQQLVAAGERVLDVQPKLGARVRLLATGDSNKNDPNDALSVAVAALRSRTRRQVSADDHAAVLKVWSRRHRDLGRAKNQVACRLHAVLCELVPGGVPEEITAAQAARILAVSHAVRRRRAGPRRARRRAPGGHAPPGCPDPRVEEEARRRGQGLGHQPHRASSASARSSPPPSSATSPTWPGSPPGTASPPITAPRRSKSPPGTAKSTGCRCAATGASTTPSTWPRSPRSGTPTATAAPTTSKKVAEGKTHKEALRSLKRRISDAIYARLQADAQPAARAAMTGPGGQPGNDSDSSAAGSHPARQLFGQATPRPATPTLRPGTPRQPTHSAPASRKGNPPDPLTALSKRSRYGRLCDQR